MVAAAPVDRSSVSLSEVLITNRIQAAQAQGPKSSDLALVLGDTRLLPHPSKQFLPADSLFLYFQAYLPEGKELKDIDLSIAIQFLKDNAVVNRLEPRKIVDTQSTMPDVVNFATAVPLAGFAPGEIHSPGAGDRSHGKEVCIPARGIHNHGPLTVPAGMPWARSTGQLPAISIPPPLTANS